MSILYFLERKYKFLCAHQIGWNKFFFIWFNIYSCCLNKKLAFLIYYFLNKSYVSLYRMGSDGSDFVF